MSLAVENPKQHFLMVAGQKFHPNADWAIAAEAFDHLRRTRAAIDHVAKEHQSDVGRPARGYIGLDLTE